MRWKLHKAIKDQYGTQRKLAKAIKMSEPEISRIVNGLDANEAQKKKLRKALGAVI